MNYLASLWGGWDGDDEDGQTNQFQHDGGNICRYVSITNAKVKEQTMPIVNTYSSGRYHLTIRIKGDPEKIRLFHMVMTKCEGDWPWKPWRQYGQVRVCQKCLGTEIHNPRVSPADIKAAAKQVGVSVKIDRYCEEIHCIPQGMSGAAITLVSQEEGAKLYQYKKKRLKLAGSVVLVGNVQMPKVIELPAPKESQMVN